jgi:hypothetical protein
LCSLPAHKSGEILGQNETLLKNRKYFITDDAKMDLSDDGLLPTERDFTGWDEPIFSEDKADRNAYNKECI